jgi:glutamate formiminotransferase / 5-formyltetrahydrofolate cyclo-ligase
MSDYNRIIECVPNFSEGRDLQKIETIVKPFRNREGVKLLDVQRDEDHNRSVITLAGEPESVAAAVLEAMDAAIALIDMRTHQGQHPRMGAVDVVPFIPIKNVTKEEAVDLSKRFAAAAAEKFHLPIFLYEASASATHRRNLSDIRKGQFEGMEEKLTQSEWKPDFGPDRMHPTAGVCAVGARMPLVAFNVNLGTDRLDIAADISRKVRHIGGGLRYCKAIGIDLKDRGIVQVSMNMTDFNRTALYQAFEMIRVEARRWGVTVVGSEIVGTVPMAALIDTAAYYLQLENFKMEQVLESRI